MPTLGATPTSTTGGASDSGSASRTLIHPSPVNPPEMEALSENVAALNIIDATDPNSGSDTEQDVPERDLPDDESVKHRQDAIDRIVHSLRAALNSKVDGVKLSPTEFKSIELEPQTQSSTDDDDEEGLDDDEGSTVAAFMQEPPVRNSDNASKDEAASVESSSGMAKMKKGLFGFVSLRKRSAPTPSADETAAHAASGAASYAAAAPEAITASAPAPRRGAVRPLAPAPPPAPSSAAPPAPPPGPPLAAMPTATSGAAVPGPPPTPTPVTAAAPDSNSLPFLGYTMKTFHGPPLQPRPAASTTAAPSSAAPRPTARPREEPSATQTAPPPLASLRARDLQAQAPPLSQHSVSTLAAHQAAPPLLSSFRQTPVPPHQLGIQRRHVVHSTGDRGAKSGDASRGLRQAPQSESQAFLGANSLGARQPPPSFSGNAESSFDFLRDILPEGAYSGLQGMQGMQAGMAFGGLGPLLHSHAYMGSSPALEIVTPSPSAQIFSPVSISDTSSSPDPRHRTKHEQEDDGGVASDHDGRRKKPKRAANATVPGQSKKFACPYFKRNRTKYSKWTSCPGPGWDEVHRVKTHLYRRHTLPIQCPRCWGVFKSDELLRSHLQQNPPCHMSENRTLVEGFTKDQEKRLRSRKKAQADTTDEDKWREIYMILFPDDEEASIPSPYYEATDYDDPSPPSNKTPGSELEDYTTFVKREMPTLVRRELEVLLQNDFHDIDQRLRSRISDMVLQLQPRLLDLYKQSQMPLSEYGQPTDSRSSGLGPDTLTPALSLSDSTRAGSGAESATPATSEGYAPGITTPSNDPGLGIGIGAYDTTGTGLGFDHGSSLGFDPSWDVGDPSVALDESFSWDEEFENLLNPSLFMPPHNMELNAFSSAGGNSGGSGAAYSYVTAPALVSQGGMIGQNAHTYAQGQTDDVPRMSGQWRQ